MATFVRRTLSAPFALVLVLASTSNAAAGPKEIETAIQRGAAFLKGRVGGNFGLPNDDHNVRFNPGLNALIGLALLEAGTPANDPAIATIADRTRDSSYSAKETYNIALCLIFLERLGRPADVPLIQILGFRLIAGQTPKGGWGYECIRPVPGDTLQQLRAGLKVNELQTGDGRSEPAPTQRDPSAKGRAPAKVHPEALQYAGTLAANDAQSMTDDNSNTQFAVMGLWVARRHGLPVEAALQAVEARFLQTQLPSGDWSYGENERLTPSMTCAGLLAIATGIVRRDERRAAVTTKAETKIDPRATRSDDPFFNPPKPAAPAPVKGTADLREAAARRGMISLARYVGTHASPRGTGLFVTNSSLGTRDLYFLWSLERVAVVYDLDRIGGVDWHAAGAADLLRVQAADGSWTGNEAERSPSVATSLALLFLCKANLTRDLRAARDDGSFNELRSGDAGISATTVPVPKNTPTTAVVTSPSPTTTIKPLPDLKSDEAAGIAAELLRANDADWSKMVVKLRDTKGASYTRGLVLAVARLDGSRKSEVREALAERLTRMTAATLRDMLKSDDVELRRAAALACAMKDDAEHIPDLIARLTDDSAVVWPAAKAGLKSLTGQDFGPPATASVDERRRAAEAWKAWYAKKAK